jgi:sigma-B regulation protein RsbU (phosphoserine phosphatase)
MSMTQAVFRTIATKIDDPSQIVMDMNTMACRGNSTGMFATLFVGVLDLSTGHLCYCNAGHEKPIIVTGRKMRYLDVTANVHIGIVEGKEYKTQEADIAAGDLILLYTDGLTEAKNLQRMEFGRDRVEHTLRTCISSPDSTPRTIVETLSRAAHRFAGEAPQSDDLAMLLFKFDAGDCLRDTITLTTDTSDVTLLGNFIKTFCEKLQLDHRFQAEIRLAVEEAVVNVMNYAYPPGQYGDVTIEAASNDVRLKFTIIDTGKPFDPTVQPEADTTLPANERRIGGLGIHIVRQIMDSINYERIDNLNVLTLRKKINQDGNTTSSSIKTENHQS